MARTFSPKIGLATALERGSVPCEVIVLSLVTIVRLAISDYTGAITTSMLFDNALFPAITNWISD